MPWQRTSCSANRRRPSGEGGQLIWIPGPRPLSILRSVSMAAARVSGVFADGMEARRYVCGAGAGPASDGAGYGAGYGAASEARTRGGFPSIASSFNTLAVSV